MKKKYHFLFPLLLFVPFASNAQWSFGIQAGYTSNWLTRGIDGDQYEKLIGMTATVPIFYQFNKHFSVGTEPGVAIRGGDGFISDIYRQSCCYTTCDCEYPYGIMGTFVGSYFQLPFFAKGSLPICNQRLAVYAQLGVGPSYLVSGTIESREFSLSPFSTTGHLQTVDFGKAKGFSRWEAGIYGGLGLSLQLRTGNLNLSTSNYQALNELYEDRFLSHSLGCSMGYSFKF